MEYKTRKEYEKNVKYSTKENCPFCSKNLEKSNKIILKTRYWIVIHNKYPYFGDKKGLIAFPKKHTEFTWQLLPEIFGDFVNVQKFIKNFFVGEEYFSFIRESKSNKSIEHLHYHFIIGIPSAKIIDGQKILKIK